MSTLSAKAIKSSTSTEAPTNAPRIVSIDIFRGLTMVIMIFVNDLASVQGLPWWTYHAHANEDRMTYVDMVFPFFLFVVGVSLPLAIERRLQKNSSLVSLLAHIVSRSAGLIVLGLILANAEKGDASRMGITPNAWAIVGLAGAILFWHLPGRDSDKPWISRGLRVAGLVILVLTFAVFRRTTDDGDAAWIDTSYPEILGLIGYTYFGVAVLYISTRRWRWAPFAWTAALVMLSAVLISRNLRVPIPLFIWPIGSGAMASITMAGIATSSVFFGAYRWKSFPQRMTLAVCFAALAWAAGRAMTPLGISKIRATPTWCLYCIGAGVLTLALLHWLCDEKRRVKWAAFVRPAGTNTLLTYLLPDLCYFFIGLMGFTYFTQHFNTGPLGVVRAALFTMLVLAISALLSRADIRLQL